MFFILGVLTGLLLSLLVDGLMLWYLRRRPAILNAALVALDRLRGRWA